MTDRTELALAEAVAIAKAVAAERERCAQLVPTNWLSNLLSGKDGIKLPLDGPGVERLLLAIKNRILKPLSE